MNAPYDNFAAAQDRYDRQLPRELVLDDWTPSRITLPLDSQIEELIESMAVRGWYEDHYGDTKHIDSLHQTLCGMWVRDRASLGEAGPELWRWARLVAMNVY